MPTKSWPRLKDTAGNAAPVYVGDTRTLTFTLKDKDGTVVSVASKTITARCNSDAEVGSASNKIFDKTCSIVGDGTAGQFTLALTPTELPTAAEGDDRHLYIIDETSSVQLVLGHYLMDILPDPDAAG